MKRKEDEKVKRQLSYLIYKVTKYWAVAVAVAAAGEGAAAYR